MYKVTITSLTNDPRFPLRTTFPSLEEATAWLEAQKLKEGRRPERIEMQTVFNEQTQLEEQVEVVIPAEATYSIVNLLEDYNYLLEQCYENRRKAYPPMSDYLDAVVKGDEVQKQVYIDACLAVKALYPKPVAP